MRIFTWLLLAGIFFSGCLDEITLKNQQFETKAIVIQGKLVNSSPAIIEVTVRRIGDFEGYETDVHQSSAQVNLFDETGASINLPEDFGNRVYRTTIPDDHPSFQVQRGHSYHLEVTLTDGRKFVSTPEELLPVPNIQKADFERFEITQTDENGIGETLPYLRFLVNAPLKIKDVKTKARLRWEMNEAYRFSDDVNKTCYYFSPVRQDKVFIYNGEAHNNEDLQGFPLAEVPLDYKFAEGYYINLIQESLSPGAYEYWDQAQKLSERRGNMFEPPVAKIKSNFKNIDKSNDPVYGYFYATEQDTLHYLVRPEQVGMPRKFCPYIKLPPGGPTRCTDCLLQANSTLLKPEYWIQ